jgi:hypothetical protein
MRLAWALWASAFASVAIFAGGILFTLHRLGWFADTIPKCPFGMDPPTYTPDELALTFGLVAMSHVCPYLVRRRAIARRIVYELGADGTYRLPPSRTPITINANIIEAAERARRVVGLTSSLAIALSIALLGFASIRVSFHGPCQHPLEWWSYFAVSAATVLSHLPRVITIRGRRPRTPCSNSFWAFRPGE